MQEAGLVSESVKGFLRGEQLAKKPDDACVDILSPLKDGLLTAVICIYS